MMKLILSLCILSVILFSCSTYLLPVNSFKNQFTGMNEKDMQVVSVQGPLGERTSYKTFSKDSVDCLNKNGQWVRLEKSPSLEIRFTDTNNRKTVFYFDRIFVTDSVVTGTYSKILRLNKTISIKALKKIEIQEGRKNYRYVH